MSPVTEKTNTKQIKPTPPSRHFMKYQSEKGLLRLFIKIQVSKVIDLYLPKPLALQTITCGAILLERIFCSPQAKPGCHARQAGINMDMEMCYVSKPNCRQMVDGLAPSISTSVCFFFSSSL